MAGQGEGGWLDQEQGLAVHRQQIQREMQEAGLISNTTQAASLRAGRKGPSNSTDSSSSLASNLASSPWLPSNAS